MQANGSDQNGRPLLWTYKQQAPVHKFVGNRFDGRAVVLSAVSREPIDRDTELLGNKNLLAHEREKCRLFPKQYEASLGSQPLAVDAHPGTTWRPNRRGDGVIDIPKGVGYDAQGRGIAGMNSLYFTIDGFLTSSKRLLNINVISDAKCVRLCREKNS
jgi:hypothetical protein